MTHRHLKISQVLRSKSENTSSPEIEKKRQIKPIRRYGYADLIGFALAARKDIDDEEPKNFKEVTQSLFKEEWQRAMDDEMASLYKNKTWELVKMPGNRRVVGCKWIFKIKEGTNGSECQTCGQGLYTK